MISVIMAAYNAENTIEAAIDSVIGQSFTDWELLIVNDCSTDRTVQIIEYYLDKDKRIRLLNNKENRGVSFSRYLAATNASGEWIAILDSDDMWDLSKLEKQNRLINEYHPEIVFTGSRFINTDGHMLNGYLSVPKQINYHELLKQNVISNSSAVVKKEIYLKYYVQRDDIHEDYATWLSALRDGCVARGINEPLLIYRISASSKSGNKLKSAMMNLRTYRFINLDIFESLKYMLIYTIRSFRKYRGIG